MEIKTLTISQFTTSTGAFYNSINLHYQHFGQAIGTAPVVLVNHSLTGDSQVTGKNGWWDEIIGSGKTIDTHLYCILAFNIPGNGTLEQTFSTPEDFHTGDIASLFIKGLKILKIDELYALIGGSIGGGIAWEMAVLFPDLINHLIVLGSDWKTSDWIIAHNLTQEQIPRDSGRPILRC